MKSKFLICLFLLICAFPATFSLDFTDTKEYPYLALIEVAAQQGVGNYYNGVFASLSWVLTVSRALAQEPTGKPRNDSFKVYGDLSSAAGEASAPKRGVKKIVTDLMSSEDNKYFPNLVLLQLDSAFPKSNTLKPATFNIGKLSENSNMVGWALDIKTNTMILKPVTFPATVISSNQCSEYSLVEFPEQFCCFSKNSLAETFHFLEGALVVDKNEYITGMLQFTSVVRPAYAVMPLMVIVRLGYYQAFWQFHVIDSQEIFLNTKFKDDLKIEPWNKPKNDKGIGLEYTQGGCVKIKEIDLSDLTRSTDIEELAFKVAKGEPLITPNIHHQLVGSLSRLQEKIFSTTVHKFYRHKTLKTHLLPITNVAFDKFGKKCLTGSYDRTCKVWDIETGEEIHTLQGHKNVVYAVTFNNQGDKILTGSFDKTALLWSVESGECKQSFSGHSGEVVAVQFDPQKQLIATASMDTTARLYNLSTGQEVSVLQGHSGEIISLQYNNTGNCLLTGSFDNTLGLWDTRTNSKLGTLSGHEAEISSCLFSQDENLVVSGSLDKSARIWDVRMLTCIHCTEGHQDEVLDVAVDLRSRQLATASSDSTVCLWDIKQACALITTLSGHSQEVSKVCFNPAGTAVLTASQDHTARLWDPGSGQCLQVLEGHSDDVFSCAFSYYGDTVITASKDNTCRIWQNTVNK